jgi:hypothetical protein
MKKLLLSLTLLILLISCNKKQSTPVLNKELELNKCSNLVGVWFCLNNDTLIKDSLVLEVDYYGFKNNKSYVQYKSNMKILDSLLWHYCPYDYPWDDDLHIMYKNKELIFRYFH